MSRMISGSFLIQSLAEGLTDIKERDDLTDAEMGAAMRRSGDQAADYRRALSEMGVVAFLGAIATWGGAFADRVLAPLGFKLVELEPSKQTDREFGVILSRLKLAVDEALVVSDKIGPDAMASIAPMLEEASRAIDARRGYGKAGQ